ncbi:MAG: hypothetical protein Q7T96_09890 [Methylobacter sp.]|nr:hypothetical protein [Methylobacter sp.]
MKDKIKKQDQQIKAAFVAGREAIVKQLSKDAPGECVLDVVMLMAHNLLTHGEQLDLGLSSHNAEVFCARLKQLIETTQKDIQASGYTGRLM